MLHVQTREHGLIGGPYSGARFISQDAPAVQVLVSQLTEDSIVPVFLGGINVGSGTGPSSPDDIKNRNLTYEM